MDPYDKKLFDERYRLVCRKCQSDSVTMHYEPEMNYSEHSGTSASMSFTCQACHDNDLVIYPS